MEQSLHAAAEKIRQGTLTPSDLLETCLQRIETYDSKVKAWVFVDAEAARERAKQLTEELKSGHYRGPLHGIPVGIKDIFDVFDWPTAAGSKLWANSIARSDCTVVRKLREAGAVFVGKTVTTQYASFDPPVTRNPWNLERTPGGSSSGSAAAVAYGGCLAAMGSQTGGSITRPASFCGVAGCKPTYGRVSLAGIVPLAHSMDHPGPITLCVRDAAIVLQTIAGPDDLDSESSYLPVPDYDAILGNPGEPPRLGILRGLFQDRAHEETLAVMETVQSQLSAGGAELVPVALPAAFSEVLAHHKVIMGVECSHFHAERLAKHPDDYDQNIRSLIENGLKYSGLDYARTREHRNHLIQEMGVCFGDVDALIAPAAVGPAPGPNTTGEPTFNSPWSYTGLPVVSFPVGWSKDGLPMAVQLIGPAFQEAELFRTALWCEQTIGLERKWPVSV